MEKNIFKLDNEQLKAIVCSFRDKTEEGLKTENAEIQCIPTFIAPKTTHIKGKSLVLDLEEPIIGWQSYILTKQHQPFTRTMAGKKTCQL